MSRRLMPRVYRAVATDATTELAEKSEVLDVGTGPGRLLIALAQSRPDLRLVGVDPSEDMVTLSRANLHAAGVADRARVQTGFAEDFETRLRTDTDRAYPRTSG